MASCSQYVAAFGFQLYIVPINACGISLADVGGGLNADGFIDPASALSESIRIEEGISPKEILAGDPGVNIVYDGETVLTQSVLQLRGVTNAGLETDTGTESVITYDEEGRGFDQAVAISKSWTIGLEAVTQYSDAAYKVLRLLESNAVSGQLKCKVGRLGPTGTSEAIYGYATVSNFSESVEAGGIVTWSAELQGHGPLTLDLDNTGAINLVGPISTISILTTGEDLKDGEYPDQALTGGTGNGLATADITVAGGIVTEVTLVDAGDGYAELNSVGADLLGADLLGTIATLTRDSVGSNLANGTYSAQTLLGGTGTGATVNVIVSGNSVTTSNLTANGSGYTTADSLTLDLAAADNPTAGAVTTTGSLVSGEGYLDAVYTNQLATGGSGSGLRLNITVTGEAVANVSVAVGGTGYTIADEFTAYLDPAVTAGTYAIQASSLVDAGIDLADGIFAAVPALGGSGSGAEAEITVVAGVVTSYTLTDTGLGYAANDLLSFNLEGSENPFEGEILSLVVTYTGASLLDGTFLAVMASGGTGTGALVDLTVTGGSITLAALSDGGTGYTADDELTFVLVGEANPDQGEIIALNSASLVGGSGYQDGTYLAVSLSGGVGVGATADIVVTGGTVTAVNLTIGGTDYLSTDVLSAADADLGNSLSGSGFAIGVNSIDESATITPSQPTITINAVEGPSVIHTDPQIEVTDVDQDTGVTPVPWSITATVVELGLLSPTQPSFTATTTATVESPHTDPTFRVTSIA